MESGSDSTLPPRGRTDHLSALLIWPPYQDDTVYAPYSAPLWLADHLTRNGLAADVLDLNRECLRELVSEEHLEGHCARLGHERTQLEARDTLDEDGVWIYFQTVSEHARTKLLLRRLGELRAEENLQQLRIDGTPYTELLGALPTNALAGQLADLAMERLSDGTLSQLLERDDLSSLNKMMQPHMERALASRSPLVLGISVAFSFQLLPALLLARTARETAPAVHICLGGAMVSLLGAPERRCLLRLGTIDSLVRHAGEDPLLRLVGAIAAGAELPEHADIFYARERRSPALRAAAVSGRALSPRAPTAIVPPRYRLTDATLERFQSDAAIAILESRGCYWGECSFCDFIHLYGENRYTPRPVAHIVEDIAFYYERGFRTFYVVTDSLPPRPAKAIAEGVLERGMTIRWRSFMKVDRRWDLQTLRAMRESGYQPTIGLDSSNDRQLAVLKKGYTQGEAHEFMEKLEAARFGRCRVNIIANPPAGTFAEALEVLEFCRQHRNVILRCKCFPLVVTPTSEIGLHPEAYGLVVQPRGAEDTYARVRALQYDDPNGMSAEELQRVRQLYVQLNAELFAEWGYGGHAPTVLAADSPAQLAGFRFTFPSSNDYVAETVAFDTHGQRPARGVFLAKEPLMVATAHTVFRANDAWRRLFDAHAGMTVDVESLATSLFRRGFESRGAREGRARAMRTIQRLTRERIFVTIEAPGHRPARPDRTG